MHLLNETAPMLLEKRSFGPVMHYYSLELLSDFVGSIEEYFLFYSSNSQNYRKKFTPKVKQALG